jgi:hypothetical protein
VRAPGVALAGLVEQLRAAGFTAALDPAELNTDPAGVWVQPRTLQRLTRDTGVLVAWLYVIAGTTDTAAAVTRLDDALEGLLELVQLADTDDVIDLAAAVALPTAPSTVLPAYRLAVDLDL